MGVDDMREIELIVILHNLFLLLPVGNSYRVTGEPLCGNELTDDFVDRSRLPEPLRENFLQDGQHFRQSPNKLLQIIGTSSSDRYRFFTEVNGCNSSSRRLFTKLSCKSGCKSGTS